MTAELVRGQNHPLPDTRLEIRVSAGHPVLLGATLGDEQGRVPGPEWIAHPGAPSRPGVDAPGTAAADHCLGIDLDEVPDTVHRISLLLALPGARTGGAARFGTLAAPFVAVTGTDGTEIATYTITGLDRESAVVALELYRRQGTWKVRAMGQGYEDGLTALLDDQGLERPAELAGAMLAGAGAGAGGGAGEGTARAGGRAEAEVGAVAPVAGGSEPVGPEAGRSDAVTESSGQGVVPETAPMPVPPAVPAADTGTGAPTPAIGTPIAGTSTAGTSAIEASAIEPPAAETPASGTSVTGVPAPGAPTPAPPAGGPIDYSHPRRRPTPSAGPAAARV
ncbi:TerD family protein, partial [Streptomyces sp. CBMA291]